MPELPEVEVTRRQMAPVVLQRTVVRVLAGPALPVFPEGRGRLLRRLPGRQIEDVERHGKYLAFRLSDRSALVIHLGMTGRLVARPISAQCGIRPATDRHLRLVLEFSGPGPGLAFYDPRQFGRVFWVGPMEPCKRLDRLGPDALVITASDFFRRIRERQAAIKGLLLDQKLLAGVGNIYADEALFFAGLRPQRRAGKITEENCDRLLTALRRVLLQAIAAGGTTTRDFLRPDGNTGSYQEALQVYGRAGKPCFRCGRPIQREVIAQRSAHYCAKCQS
ncbi:bifunctional DNA-formamidopyrimidine glycosylase/DNA-(apurinic or apyrimidinic site) lyase [Myxococcota bacterium]